MSSLDDDFERVFRSAVAESQRGTGSPPAAAPDTPAEPPAPPSPARHPSPAPAPAPPSPPLPASFGRREPVRYESTDSDSTGEDEGKFRPGRRPAVRRPATLPGEKKKRKKLGLADITAEDLRLVPLPPGGENVDWGEDASTGGDDPDAGVRLGKRARIPARKMKAAKALDTESSSTEGLSPKARRKPARKRPAKPAAGAPETNSSETGEEAPRARRRKRRVPPQQPVDSDSSVTGGEGPPRAAKVRRRDSAPAATRRPKEAKQPKQAKAPRQPRGPRLPKLPKPPKGPPKKVGNDSFVGRRICLLAVTSVERQAFSVRIIEEGGELVDPPGPADYYVAKSEEAFAAALAKMGGSLPEGARAVRSGFVPACLKATEVVDPAPFLLGGAAGVGEEVKTEPAAEGAEARAAQGVGIDNADTQPVSSSPPRPDQPSQVNQTHYVPGTDSEAEAEEWYGDEPGPQLHPHPAADPDDGDGPVDLSAPFRPAGRAPRNLPTRVQEKFQCMQPNPIRAKGSKPPCVNEDIVQELEAIRKHLDAAPKKEADNFRVIQYRKAIQSIRRYPKRITSVEEAKKVYQVGERIAEKIGEFLRTGRTQRLAHLENDPEQRTLELFRSVHGCGSAQASQWYNQGMRTLDDLRARTDLTRQQRIGLELYDELNTRIPRAEVEAMIALVNQVAAGVDVLLEVHDQGSYRRGAPDSGDVDLLITHPNEAKRMESSHALVRQLVAEGIVTHELAWGEGNVFMGVAKLPVPGSIHRRIDLLCIPFSEIGAALLHFTGNDIFNRSLRLLAKKKGYTLSQHGLHVANRFTKDPELKRGKLVASETEEAIFAALGVPWRPPHERNVGVEFEGWVNGGASSAGPSSDVLPASDAEPGWGAPDLRADDEVHSD